MYSRITTPFFSKGDLHVFFFQGVVVHRHRNGGGGAQPSPLNFFAKLYITITIKDPPPLFFLLVKIDKSSPPYFQFASDSSDIYSYWCNENCSVTHSIQCTDAISYKCNDNEGEKKPVRQWLYAKQRFLLLVKCNIQINVA